ncbi:hypothetical protein [Nonomuraea typhae]|uniref:Uncharacterized protein n=1 Tax=Nonomuraea typhae TaxID=2603600 RepID=A0ABW7Z4Y7_9ACTN
MSELADPQSQPPVGGRPGARRRLHRARDETPRPRRRIELELLTGPIQGLDDDKIAYARTLRDRGVAVPDIAAKLIIPTGKNQGSNPSVASVYRILY